MPFQELLQECIQLKREVPLRSVNQIILILEMEGRAAPGVLKRSTVQRHLERAGFGRAQMKKHLQASRSSSRRYWKPHRMMLVQADIKYGPKLPIGKHGRMTQTYLVVILDEAHLLEKETIEEFRFLLNYRFDSMSPVALLLVGQNELLDKLKLQRYAAVRQRIDIFCTLGPLDRADTARYIQSHLAYAGGRTDIFTDRAIDNIYRFSHGIPRMINRISEKSLMYAAQQQKRLIDEHDIQFIQEHEMLGGIKE